MLRSLETNQNGNASQDLSFGTASRRFLGQDLVVFGLNYRLCRVQWYVQS